MSITRSLLTSAALLPLLAACQVYTGKPEGPPPATRLQGQVQVENGQLVFTPCQEQRRFVLIDGDGTGIEREAMQLGSDGQASLFADLAGRLGGSQGKGNDGRFEVSQIYRLQGEGHGCDDLNFKRLTLRASGNEPFWQLEVGSKGLVLNRPEQEPLALPYLEEQLPDAVELMVRSLRVGHPFSSAIGIVSKEVPDPLGTEFGLIADEAAYGRDVAESLKAFAERMDNQDLRFLAVAVTIQQQSGGNLAEILDGLAKVIRARFKLFRRVKAITAEAKWSGMFLSFFPVVLVHDCGRYRARTIPSPLCAPPLIRQAAKRSRPSPTICVCVCLKN